MVIACTPRAVTSVLRFMVTVSKTEHNQLVVTAVGGSLS